MRGVNKIILIGNATRDAELHHTGSGKAVTGIRLATNRTVRGQEETQFHTVVCWEGLAETTSTYVKKGDTLWNIAEMHYGKGQGAKHTEIVKANTPPVKDPDLIQPGWVLRIPDAKAGATA